MSYLVRIDIEPINARYEITTEYPPLLPAVGETLYLDLDEQEEAKVAYHEHNPGNQVDYGEFVVLRRQFSYTKEKFGADVLLTVGFAVPA